MWEQRAEQGGIIKIDKVIEAEIEEDPLQGAPPLEEIELDFQDGTLKVVKEIDLNLLIKGSPIQEREEMIAIDDNLPETFPNALVIVVRIVKP